MRLINWEWPSYKLHNWVRGLSPYPSMYTTLNGKRIKVFKTFVENSSWNNPGNIFQVKNDSILVGTGNGLLGILEVQMEGKKKLSIKEFLRGRSVNKDWIFGLCGTDDVKDEEFKKQISKLFLLAYKNKRIKYNNLKIVSIF